MTLLDQLGAAAGGAIADWLQAQSSMAGQIIAWPVVGNIPVGWLECDGRTLAVADYSRLFAVISNAYGGDGTAAFALPDLRGRMPLGRSAMHAAGQYIGAESASVTLSEANLPAHSHSAIFTSSTAGSSAVSVTIPVDAASGDTNVPGNTTVLGKGLVGSNPAKVYSTAASTATLKPFDISVPIPAISGAVLVSNTGIGQPLSVPTLSPALVMTWIICTGIGITQPVGYSWHGVKTTYQALSQADLAAKLAADAEFASAVAIMLTSGQMTDRLNGTYARWDFDQAKLDAVNLSLSDLQNRMNPAHASYSPRFADMYKLMVGTGVVPERLPVVRLLPVLSSATWPENDGLPAGTISASSVYDDTYAAWKAADSNSTGTFWYPAENQQIGSWIQIELARPFVPKTLFFRTSPSNYRPTEVQVQVGDHANTLSVLGTFSLAAPAPGALFSEHLLTLPATAPCTILRMTVTAVADAAVAGYPIFDLYATGVPGA